MRFKTRFNPSKQKRLYSLFFLILCVFLLNPTFTIYRTVQKEMQYYASIGRLENLTQLKIVELGAKRLKNAILLQTKWGRDAYRAHYGADPPPPGYRHEQYEGGIVRLVPLINPRPEIEIRTGFAPNPEQLAKYLSLKKKFEEEQAKYQNLMIFNAEPDDAKLKESLEATASFERETFGKTVYDFNSRKGLIAKMQQIEGEMNAIETDIDNLIATAQGEVPIVSGYLFIYEGKKKTEAEKKKLLQSGLKNQTYRDVINKAYRDAGLSHLIGTQGITTVDTVPTVQPVETKPPVNLTLPDK